MDLCDDECDFIARIALEAIKKVRCKCQIIEIIELIIQTNKQQKKIIFR